MSTGTVFVMPGAPWIDVLDPTAAMIHFPSLAERLAKEPRFNGGTPGVVYGVAQHSVLGADAIIELSGDREAAAYFLLHDAHEGTGVKDITTPFKNAVAETAHEQFGVVAPVVLESFARLTDKHDRAIHTAAGLRWPPTEKISAVVKHFDKKMFVTEWRDLMRGCEHPDWENYRGVEPLADRIAPWPWSFAHEAMLDRMRALLPVFA